MDYRSAIGLLAFSGVCFAQFDRKENEADDKQSQREEWFYTQRAYPRTRIPVGARMKGMAELERMDRLRLSGNGEQPRALATGAWKSIGPQPTSAGTIFVTSGRVNSIAIDPRNSKTIYIGSAEGGVWKTTNGGTTWKSLTDSQASLASGAIAIDPSNSETIYVGTGEENFAIDSYYGAGILKSTDAGASWKNIVGPFLHAYIGGIAVSPANSQVLLCASDIGVFRSTDGAETWSRVLPGIGTAVLFDPTNGNIAYAALGSPFGAFNNGVYRSTDGGQTFESVRGTGSSVLPTTNVGRISLTIAPSAPTTLYAAFHDYVSGSLMDIYKTTDSGTLWNRTHAPDICFATGQCWYDMTVRVSPTDPNLVFAGGQTAIIQTTDGGATWLAPYFIGPNQEQAIHPDYHDLQFTPDGSTLYIANDGGMYKTSDVTTELINWTELNDTLSLTQFYPGIAIHPSNLKASLAGTQDNGLQRYSGNSSWDYVNCGDGGFSAIDRIVPSIAYTACVSGDIIDRTTDGGSTWIASQYGIDTSDRAQFVAPMTIDPSNSRTLYFGTYRVWQTRDGAGQWLPISPDLTNGHSASIKAIAVAPSDPNIVYAGTSDGKVQVTSNALAGLKASWIDRSSGLTLRTLTSITVDPIDSATAYVTYSGFLNSTAKPTQHVFKTIDSGAKWTDISGNLPDLPVNSLAVDPDLPDTLYIGTDAGVMVTTNGGTSWSTLGSGMPKVVVEAVLLHRPTRTLRAATHGRGVWDILIPLPSTSGSNNPTLTALTPSTANAGSKGLSLSVTGANFWNGSTLRWNGVNRTSKVVDATHLTAQISAADTANVGIADVDVFNPSSGGGASNALAFTIGPAPNPLAAVNAAAGTQKGLAPGSIAALYGTNLAGTTAAAISAPPLPFTLGGTALTLQGQSPVALFYVSPLQIDFQVPFVPVFGTTPATLTVTQGSLSQTLSITLVPFAPAIFTTNSQGTGQAAALIGASLAAPIGAFPGSRPAKPGDSVSIFCTGLGNVTHAPDSGAPASSNPLSHTLGTPFVTLGEVKVSPSFSGLAPGFVGLYQVNIQIPSGAPSGSAVPMVLMIGGAASNTATIAIQ
ncbi:MAG TPA: hypothetical protein VKT81_26840 [Bryobacteraceae bacterium]|nr:hypothetical protein [Bryobacteraceae bacterium]